MEQISDHDLLELNRRGFIPGPEETREQFCKRASLCSGLDISPILQESENSAKWFYDIFPDWVPIVLSNEKLSFWHGGCTCFIRSEEGTATFLQLDRSLKNHSNFFHIYTREEIVAHELAHVGRMAFEEPKFEEIIAYRSSPSRFRRWFGPIVQSSKEAIIFIIVLMGVLLMDAITLFTDGPYILWPKALPLAMMFYGFCRLWRRQRTFHRCLIHLKDIIPDEKRVNGIIYRLTDEEILRFAKAGPKEIKAYAEEQSQRSLRWRLIVKAYFE